jgi:hypothetical protein
MNVATIAMKFASLFLAGSILLLLFKRVKTLKKYGIITLIYFLLISVLLATPTLILLFDLQLSDFVLLISVQILITLLGVMHVVFGPSILPWYSEVHQNVKIFFILAILVLAYFFSDMSISYLVNPKLRFVWHLSLLWFIVPILLNETVNLLLKVPPKEFKKWHYPINERIDDPTDEELENPVVISFIFRKNDQNHEVTTFRAKAPAGMKLGRLFYFFINDYNDRHPESKISFVNSEGEPNGWVFMKIKNKFLGNKQAIDPDSSIYSNSIRENDVLICNRF